MARVFISYRREDSAGHVGRLHDRLITRFGREQVFKDIDSIKPGEDFTQAIKDAMASCDVVLVVIGKQWLTGTDAKGSSSVGTAFLKPTPRLDNPKDFLRQEIAAALTGKTRVIPVLVQGATMPNEEDLPEDLRGLAKHNAIEISDVRWDFDVDRLAQAIQKEPLFSRKALLVGSAALGFAVVSLVTYIFFSNSGSTSDKEAKTNTSISGSTQDSRDKPPGDDASNPTGRRRGNVGDELSTAQWGFQVRKVSMTDEYVERYYQAVRVIRPEGKNDILLVIDARLTNRLQKTQSPVLTEREPGNTGLSDSEGHSYQPLDYDARQAMDKVQSYEGAPLLPGAVADFALVFSVPKGTQPKTLVMTLTDYPALGEGTDVTVQLN